MWPESVSGTKSTCFAQCGMSGNATRCACEVEHRTKGSTLTAVT